MQKLVFLAPGKLSERFDEQYEVLGELARGSFGEAFLVLSRWDKKEYVVKRTLS